MAEPQATPQPENEPIAAEPAADDVDDDRDSALSLPTTTSLTSLRSSVRQFQQENGRTYHAMSSGKYAYPNDEAESERLDLQHNLWLLTLRGALCLSPKEKGANRVLDAGTGTGIWAIEYADLHPEAEVIGVDLSPIQPTLVPPNCSFEVDDLEKEWTWAKKFDFVFSRIMAGSFSDYEAYIRKAYDALEPGGYLEMQDLHTPFESDDGTLTEDSDTYKLGKVFADASEKLGRPLTVAPTYKAIMEKVGFVDIVETKLKWPINNWPADKYYKELGMWYLANLDTGLEGLLMALCTRGLEWTAEETQVFCTSVRKSLRNRKIHAYLPIYVVYGKKPE